MITRHNGDWTSKFRDLAHTLGGLGVENAYFDGEVVILNDKGLSDFGALQNWFKSSRTRPLTYYIFDCLFLNGEDLRPHPLRERKKILETLLASANLPRVYYSDHQVGAGDAFFAAASKMGLEGILSKKADAAYVSGRSHGWLKVKRIERQEFVIGGFTLSNVSKTSIGALLLGEYDGDELVYVGKVGTGYTHDSAADLFRRLFKIKRDRPSFSAVPSDVRRNSVWVKPQHVAEIEFGAWTSDHILRHAAYLGLREDKEPKDVKRERTLPVKEIEKEQRTSKTRKSTKEAKGSNAVLGVAISHPERVIFPKEKITKLDVARYYEAVGSVMLPYVSDRPLALVRCPEGVSAACFFQKHAGMGLPASIREERIGPKKEDAVLLIDSEEGLVSLVQRGVLEVHIWGSHFKTIEKPDLLVFDFDPDPSVKWPEVVKAALRMRDLLEDLDLESYTKTTGGKGLHVVVPIKPLLEWDAIKQFCRAVAAKFAAQDPERFLINMSKEKRKGKIFVDYLRNGRGSTAVAPYSTRARPGGLIATPLSWRELEKGAVPADFTLESVVRRVAKGFKDPWKGMLSNEQSLTVKMIEALHEDRVRRSGRARTVA